MVPAMILAAGLGTRLKPLTDFVAKPLVPVGDGPMISHVITRLRAAGCAPIVANAHHHRDELARYCTGESVLVSREDDLLGTAGGLAHAASLLGEGDVLVHNGDVLVDVDLTAVVHDHIEARCDATLVIVEGPAHSGNVGVDARGRIVRLRKETFASGEVSAGEFTGIHIASAHLRATLPAKGCIIGDVYMPLLRAHQSMTAGLRMHPARSLIDIGSPAGYLAANLAWLEQHGMPSYVGPRAKIGPNVTLEKSVIGEGAAVGGDGSFKRCVVWPGAVAMSHASDTVFAAHGIELHI